MMTAPVTADAATVFLNVRPRQLHPSPTNPRKEFPEGSIEEMRASVAAHGVIQPLIVRRWPEKDRADEDAFEIVCGERRFRGASRVAGLEWIPVMVRVLTDTQVREIQIIENLQREDVSPYDEAVGYAALLELEFDGERLYSVERIAEKIGKNVNYVRNRLKMQRTPKVLLDALRAGVVGTRICEMVGRIPHAEDRERCAAEILEDQHYDRAMTIEEAQAHINEEYMIKLATAPFDRESEDLLPKAGSCEACPHRTGKDPELVDELMDAGKGKGSKGGIDPQVCQNPKCFRDKCEAFLKQVKAAEPERVLSDDEVKAVFDDWGHVRHTAKLKAADRKPDYADVGHYDSGKLKTWGEYAKRLGVPTRLARNPKTGEVVTLVEPSMVKAAERSAAPAKPVFVQKGTSKEEGSQEKYQKEEKRRRELQAEEVRIAFDRLAGNLMGALGRPELLMILGQACDHQGIDVMLRWMGIKAGPQPKGREFVSARAHKIEAILAAVRDDTVKYDREAILILTLMAQFSEAVSYNGIATTRFKEFASVRGVDLKEVTKDAKALLKERRAAGKAAPKAQGEASPAATGEGESGGGGEGETSPEVKGAFEMNENGVILNPDVVELVSEKKCKASARLALKGGAWYAGYEFAANTTGSSGPWWELEGFEFDTRDAALDDVAYQAWSFFKRCEESGEKVPAAVFAKLEEFRLKPEMAGQSQDEPAPLEPSLQLEEDLATVVRHFGKVGGTASIDAVKISQQLGWASDRAISVVNELRGRKMIVMGCLERDSEAVKAILAAMDPQAPAAPSKLAAAAARKKAGKAEEATPSASWQNRLDLDAWDKLYAKLMKAIKTWGPETIFDPTWVKAWVAGVKDDKTAEILLEEAVHRGAIAADQVVMKGE